jgi:hypothetical protein
LRFSCSIFSTFSAPEDVLIAISCVSFFMFPSYPRLNGKNMPTDDRHGLSIKNP